MIFAAYRAIETIMLFDSRRSYNGTLLNRIARFNNTDNVICGNT